MLLEWMKTAPTCLDDPHEGFDPDAVTVSDVVDIAAPAQQVWDILCDMPRYGEWNPFCVRAESTLEMGAPVHMTLVNYAVPGTLIPNCEYICAFEPGHLISWEMKHSAAWPYAARRDQLQLFMVRIGYIAMIPFSVRSYAKVKAARQVQPN